MNRTQQMGIRRLIKRRAHGQSIPLIALAIVIVVAMVGLSVDVGNTFARERQVVAASNAASVAGMNAYLDSTGLPPSSAVYNAINQSLQANGVNPSTPGLTISRTYLDIKGEPIAGNSEIRDEVRAAPANVAYVEVKVTGTVDTYFARVVSRNTLPFNATTYAGACPAGSGIYPIGVYSAYLQGDAFVNPGDDIPGELPINWRRISGGAYDGFTARRIYLKEQANVPGGFSWLQWDPSSSGGNTPALVASLSGFGNLTQGFAEDPWPEGYPNRPVVYPEKPGELNAGDWVAGNTGLSHAQGVMAAMRGHIENGTRMILPIFDASVGQGQSGSFHIVRMGLFVLVGFDKENGKDYFDLVFLGDPTRQRTACVVSIPPTPPMTELTGTVQFQPSYGARSNSYRPVQYVVSLDVSGSMNMTFDGIGSNPTNGQSIQCTNGPAGSGTPQTCTPNASYAYRVLEQRRVYVAKKALELLVSLTNMPGNANYNANLPKDRMAVTWWSHAAPASWKVDFTSDPAALRTAIRNAGSQNGDPYKTDGGTNGAGGLYRVAQLFQNAPRMTNELGQNWTYRRVVLYVTDGVSNEFLDTSAANLSGGTSDSNTFPQNSYCKRLGAAAREDAGCQTNEIGGIYQNRYDRPVTSMVKIANDNIKGNAAVGSEIYVVALSNIAATGLENGVASTDRFFPARSLELNSNGETNVDRIIRLARGYSTDTSCIPTQGEWQNTLSAGEFANIGGLVYPIVGQVTLTNSATGFTKTEPIVAGTSGALSYRFTQLPRGTYELSAVIFYKHPQDPNPQPRRYSWIYENENRVSNVTVSVGERSVTSRNLRLQADGQDCVVTN